MIDFTLTEREQEIVSELKAEGQVARKYARYYDDNEEELYPDEFPEAKDFTKINKLVREQGEAQSSPSVLRMLMGIYRSWAGSVPLKSGIWALGNAALAAAGTREQKERWGNTTLAMSITEPGCGSDSKAIKTTAALDGDEWVINGDKIFVTTGVRAEGVVVWATIDRSAGRAGIKSFVVMKGTPGFEMVRKEKKMGIRHSDTAALSFDNCRIPRDHLLGGDESIPKKGSGGFKGVMKTFNMTRPGVAAGGIGNALASFEFAQEQLATLGEEVDWEQGTSNRSAQQQKLIEIESDLEAATLTTYRAAWLADQGLPNNLEASVSKSKGGEISRTVPQRSIDILGPVGLSQNHLLEKWFRDARITDIYEGTGQVQRLIIAREILGYTSAELS